MPYFLTLFCDFTDLVWTANKGIYELKRPITFEGKEIKEIDLSGLEDLTGKDVR